MLKFMAHYNDENASLSYPIHVSSSAEGGQSTITEEVCKNNYASKSRTDNVVVRFAEPLVTDTAFTYRSHASNMSDNDKQSMFYSPEELRAFRKEAATTGDIHYAQLADVDKDGPSPNTFTLAQVLLYVCFIDMIP
jgi:hypothetical protein